MIRVKVSDTAAMNGLQITGMKLTSPAPTKKLVAETKPMKSTATPLRKPTVPRTNKNTVKKEDSKKKVVKKE